MSILYSCVNQGKELLTEFPIDEHPQLAETMQRVIATIPPNEYRRKTVEDKEGGVNYNYISNGEGLIVACVATSDKRMRMVFAFLEAIEPLIRDSIGSEGSELRNGKKLLRQKMDYYNHPGTDKIVAMSDGIDQIVEVMRENVEKVLARGENLDLLVDRATNLSNQAQEFNRCSSQLKRNLCIKNLKLTLMIAGVIVIFLIIILMIICKPNFSRCS
ncbi:unnamed protein product [Phytomonas sp. Hart1]|nr:unnamed protein product [Phytomonas sp. Hart1]|eukprot:CCW68541.1 unnamed protein product [Phytomonas sp. isolate Hart1]